MGLQCACSRTYDVQCLPDSDLSQEAARPAAGTSTARKYRITSRLGPRAAAWDQLLDGRCTHTARSAGSLSIYCTNHTIIICESKEPVDS